MTFNGNSYMKSLIEHTKGETFIESKYNLNESSRTIN
jgi:hypothetical protein